MSDRIAVECQLCSESVGLSLKTGRMLDHTFWISGHRELCAFSRKSHKENAIQWANEALSRQRQQRELEQGKRAALEAKPRIKIEFGDPR